MCLGDNDDTSTAAMSQRLEASNEDSYLSSGRPSNLLRTSFSNARLETLYRASSLQQRRGGLYCFLISAIFYGIYTIASPEPELIARGVTAVFLGLNLGLLVWAEHGIRARDALWSAVPHVVWQLWAAQLLLQLFLKSTEVTPRDGLGWLLLLLYLLFATLPLRISLCALLALGTALMYIVAVVGLSKAPAQMPIDVLVGNVIPHTHVHTSHIIFHVVEFSRKMSKYLVFEIFKSIVWGHTKIKYF